MHPALQSAPHALHTAPTQGRPTYMLLHGLGHSGGHHEAAQHDDQDEVECIHEAGSARLSDLGAATTAEGAACRPTAAGQLEKNKSTSEHDAVAQRAVRIHPVPCPGSQQQSSGNPGVCRMMGARSALGATPSFILHLSISSRGGFRNPGGLGISLMTEGFEISHPTSGSISTPLAWALGTASRCPEGAVSQPTGTGAPRLGPLWTQPVTSSAPGHSPASFTPAASKHSAPELWEPLQPIIRPKEGGCCQAAHGNPDSLTDCTSSPGLHQLWVASARIVGDPASTNPEPPLTSTMPPFGRS